VRLLLDEMWSPDIAEQLRRRGHDVIAVAERPDLRRQSDNLIFATAQREGYTIVTENVADFRSLGIAADEQGQSHHGLIFTSNRQFPRHNPRTLGRLVIALDELLSKNPDDLNFEHWLSS